MAPLNKMVSTLVLKNDWVLNPSQLLKLVFHRNDPFSVKLYANVPSER